MSWWKTAITKSKLFFFVHQGRSRWVLLSSCYFKSVSKYGNFRNFVIPNRHFSFRRRWPPFILLIYFNLITCCVPAPGPNWLGKSDTRRTDEWWSCALRLFDALVNSPFHRLVYRTPKLIIYKQLTAGCIHTFTSHSLCFHCIICMGIAYAVKKVPQFIILQFWSVLLLPCSKIWRFCRLVIWVNGVRIFTTAEATECLIPAEIVADF